MALLSILGIMQQAAQANGDNFLISTTLAALVILAFVTISALWKRSIQPYPRDPGVQSTNVVPTFEFNSPRDSGYASSDHDSEEEGQDPELSSLRRAIRMCARSSRSPRTPREEVEESFEVFASFASASTGTNKDGTFGVGLGLELDKEEDRRVDG
ncbi:Hypothetical predicted protein [Lecanosticta acicola]|uniref:Uncharacterized protein n=1 Tax=Lecanosticta acicola TaxID=111012 RepID=A0AAI8YYR8_9PEZI|nr:Hypothetical predicted protein [Lecanosticta acicola]